MTKCKCVCGCGRPADNGPLVHPVNRASKRTTKAGENLARLSPYCAQHTYSAKHENPRVANGAPNKDGLTFHMNVYVQDTLEVRGELLRLGFDACEGGVFKSELLPNMHKVKLLNTLQRFNASNGNKEREAKLAGVELRIYKHGELVVHEYTPWHNKTAFTEWWNLLANPYRETWQWRKSERNS